MAAKKKKLELKPKPDDREIVIRAIADSIEKLSVSQIIQLISGGWITNDEISDVLLFLSESGKVKLKTAIDEHSKRT